MAMLKIPVSKAKGEYVEIDTQTIPDEMYQEALFQGLKQMVARGYSKITKTQYPKEDELKAAAVAKAKENVEAIAKNDQKAIKLSGKPGAAKVSGAVKTESMRIARNLVKDELKRLGYKLKDVTAAEITAAAKAYIDSDPTIVEQAEKNLKERETVSVKEKINLADLIKSAAPAPKVEKPKKDKPLSAKQAGMVAPRAKPEAKPSATLQ